MRKRRPQSSQSRQATPEEIAWRVSRVQKYLADGVTLKQACKNVDRTPGWYRNLVDKNKLDNK